MTLRVGVTSDVICPWCFVGKRRLEKAVAALGGRRKVVVRWHPFELNPHMPKEGMDRRAYRTAKFGSWERSLALDAQIMEVGEVEGIAFALNRITRTPNTLDAHRLIRVGGADGVQDAVVEALFRAYFTEGRDIGDRETLLDVVAGAGMSRDRAEAALGDTESVDAIRSAEAEAHRLGVQGVPFFVVNSELALSGAQPPAAFLAAFDRIVPPAPEGDGEGCVVRPGELPTC